MAGAAASGHDAVSRGNTIDELRTLKSAASRPGGSMPFSRSLAAFISRLRI
jgi:hypothetical protein